MTQASEWLCQQGCGCANHQAPLHLYGCLCLALVPGASCPAHSLLLQEDMRKKIEKWQEKGPAKQGRVLPVPDMEPKKRRGGKRARKYKERYGLTDTKKVLPAEPHPSGQPGIEAAHCFP